VKCKRNLTEKLSQILITESATLLRRSQILKLLSLMINTRP